LQKYGMIGTFFVLTGPADDGEVAYLSWDMIQAMSNAGMDIQLHSRDHLDMRNRPYDWLVFQIIGGRQSIEGHTGKPVIFMAYPSGKYDANVERFLRDTNFWAAVTTASGSRHVLNDSLVWDRVRISGQLRLQDFAKLLGINVSTQQAAPRPTATPTATLSPSPAGSLTPTLAPTVVDHAPTMTPTVFHTPPTPTPSSTHIPATDAPPYGTPSDGTDYPTRTPSSPPNVPTRTPFSSPLITPTYGPSPLVTPTLR